MSFIVVWFIASLITFANRYKAVVELDLSFYLGVVLTGLWWSLGIGAVLIVIYLIVVALAAAIDR